MPVYVVVGAQWGDEGKGKVCDFLAGAMDLVVRYQGGANAGHTVVFDDRKIVLHQIPSGILSPRARSVIGNGCVVDPVILASEIRELAAAGVHVGPENLIVSQHAHLVTPLHRFLDEKQNGAIGTTGRGIGPCYTDKAQRSGIRLESLMDGSWRGRMREHGSRHEDFYRVVYGVGYIDVEESIRALEPAVALLQPLIGDTAQVVCDAVSTGGSILFEGAQGTFLDLDHGTYPYVTSSTTTVGGAISGGGVYVHFDRRIAVMKAYATRVGEGPFPTELTDETGRRLREVGREYGATTGRARRCGWLDLSMGRRACMINGFDYVVLTKLDCLSGLPVLRAAVGRASDGTPDYVDMEGWDSSIAGVTSFHELPVEARRYVAFIEEYLCVPVGMISTGPSRSDIIIRKEP
ncbi:adenylosuccinate synthase [Candidatus Fermentibacteria bacterium]|nr:adenylosuccinate synthase [Candidatus Fermentibacteria bacterium]